MPDLLLDIEIAASPERVWSVLTDFAAYPAWNPYQTFEGRAEPFAIVQISSRDLTGRALQVFNAAIWKLEPGRKLELLVGKLFWLASRRIFHLEAVGDGTRLRHGLVFSGIVSAWKSPSAQEMENLRPLFAEGVFELLFDRIPADVEFLHAVRQDAGQDAVVELALLIGLGDLPPPEGFLDSFPQARRNDLRPPQEQQQFYRQMEAGIEQAYDIASEAMACNMMEPEALEGVLAFVEKRKPAQDR